MRVLVCARQVEGRQAFLGARAGPRAGLEQQVDHGRIAEVDGSRIE